VPETSQKPTTTPKKKTEPKKKAKKSKKARKGKARKGKARQGKKARRANGDGRRVVQYATTAGHCTLTANDATEQTHAPGTGPVISLSQRSAGGAIVPGPRIGRVVYTGNPFPPLYPNPDLPEYMDIGIIELDPGVVTNPAVCHFGGPTALRQGPVEAPEMLHLYGTGGQTGLNRETGTTLLPGRSGLGSSALHPNVVSGSYPTSGGDSGSPITDAAGRAVALVTSNAHQPRIEVSLARAEKVLGLDLELRTAPLATGAAPFGIASECVPPKAQA
jgi:hypothetical protein